MNEVNERVSDWILIREWVKTRGGQIFPTFSATEWFIRRHRPRLVASGQFIVRKGSAGSVVGPAFDAVVLAILREESARAVSEEAA